MVSMIASIEPPATAGSLDWYEPGVFPACQLTDEAIGQELTGELLNSRLVALAAKTFGRGYRLPIWSMSSPPPLADPTREVGWHHLFGQILSLRPDRVSLEVKVRSLDFLQTYLHLYQSLCQPLDISADGENGLVIDWKKDGRFLEAIWPDAPNEPPYLYFSTPSDFGTEEPLTPELLRSRLNWVHSRD